MDINEIAIKLYLDSKNNDCDVYEVSINYSILTSGKSSKELEEILKTYQNLKKGDVKLVEVTTAIEMESENRNLIKSKLSKQYATPLLFTFNIDKSIINGIVIKIGDDLLDRSTKEYINKLKIK